MQLHLFVSVLSESVRFGLRKPIACQWHSTVVVIAALYWFCFERFVSFGGSCFESLWALTDTSTRCNSRATLKTLKNAALAEHSKHSHSSGYVLEFLEGRGWSMSNCLATAAYFSLMSRGLSKYSRVLLRGYRQ